MKNTLLLVFLAFSYSSIIGQSFTVGGTVWGEEDNNSHLNPGERGGYKVIVELRTSSNDLILSTKTDSNGIYQFTYNLPGKYRIILPEINFNEGGPLYGLSSCWEIGLDDNIDNDNNGYPDSNGITSELIDLQIFETDLTIDFCFRADCGLENPLSVPLCENADTICDINQLNVFCSKLNSQNPIGHEPNPLCEGSGTPENMSWFAFVAGNGNYAIEFEAFSCIGGLNSAQLGIYENCSFANPIFCKSEPCFTGKQLIPSTIFVPGKVYYLWINGCKGSVCRYQIKIIGDFKPFNIPQVENLRCSGAFGICDTICIDEKLIVDVGKIYENYIAKYYWKITSPSNTIANIISTNRFLNHKFLELGKHSIELSGIEAKCSLPINNSVSINVEVVESSSSYCSSSDTCHVTVYDTVYNTIIDTNFIDIPRYISVTDTLIINLNVPNALNELVSNKISIYPNPASTHIYIDMGTYTLLKNYELHILNSLGQPVYFTPIEQQQYSVDLNQWGGKGIYYVRIKNSAGITIETKKIILQ